MTVVCFIGFFSFTAIVQAAATTIVSITITDASLLNSGVVGFGEEEAVGLGVGVGLAVGLGFGVAVDAGVGVGVGVDTGELTITVFSVELTAAPVLSVTSTMNAQLPVAVEADVSKL